jgi:hypothetical protein
MSSEEGGFCGACGQPLTTQVHGDCARRLVLDPPHFCSVCGFRLDVQVFPDGYRSSCRECRRRARAV